MKKLISFIIITIITLSLTYCALWLYSAEFAKKEIANFYNNSADNLNMFIFYGDKPVLSGFPGIPKITYEGKLEIHNVTIDAKKIELYGFPIPYFPITIEIDDKFSIREGSTNTFLTFNYLKGSIITPKSLPKTVLQQDLRKWQKEVGHITLETLELRQGSAELIMSGPIGLDRDLQPKLSLKTLVKNHREFINYFVAEGKLQPYVAGFVSGYLDNMLDEQQSGGESVNDPYIANVESDAKYADVYLDIRIRINEGQLSIGPFRIKEVKFPPIIWKE